jgi:uncharacterized protein (TIGR02117 family)
MKVFRKIVRVFARISLYFIGFVLFYLLVMFTLSRIPVNKTDKDPAKDVAIYIKSNGVHTDIVLPLKNRYKDWTKSADPLLTRSRDSTYLYAAFGWGDRDFYLHTPQWSDLKAGTAFKAAFYLGTGVMHVTFYHGLTENSRCVKVWVSHNEYLKMVAFVEASFTHGKNNNFVLVPKASYGDDDNFYEAGSKYNLCYTCNSWANNCLKRGGQKAALWTLTDGGILCHYQ